VKLVLGDLLALYALFICERQTGVEGLDEGGADAADRVAKVLYALLLELRPPGKIGGLLAVALRDDVGIVGDLLLRPDGELALRDGRCRERSQGKGELGGSGCWTRSADAPNQSIETQTLRSPKARRKRYPRRHWSSWQYSMTVPNAVVLKRSPKLPVCFSDRRHAFPNRG
jgi:hypothetical protein